MIGARAEPTSPDRSAPNSRLLPLADSMLGASLPCRPPSISCMIPVMAGSFAGTTAEYYARYRRGYPDSVVDAVVRGLGIGSEDVVLDLGCGTGLLTAPLARRARLVLGVDPAADMLAIARGDTQPELGGRLLFLLGADDDLPAVTELLGAGSVSALTVGQALHFIDAERLFANARALLRPGGGIAVIANGTPIWQQDSDWSRALRDALDNWFGRPSRGTCGTDRATQARYSDMLSAAGYEVEEYVEEYDAELTLEEVIGGLFSAMSPEDVPDDRRGTFVDGIQRALLRLGPFCESVRVHVLMGRSL